MSRILRISDGLGHEAFDVDDDTHDLAGGDEPAVVVDRHCEDHLAAFDVTQDCFGVHHLTNRRWLEVVDLDPHPDRGRTWWKPVADRRDRSLLAERDHARGRQHRDRTGAAIDRRVGVGDGESCLAAQTDIDCVRHRYEVRRVRAPSCKVVPDDIDDVFHANRSVEPENLTESSLVRLRCVIEQDVLERVLGTALRNGGDFAEVYAEDKFSTSAGLDDGRVEQVTSGRDRGAGIRVVRGETTGFAYTADLSESGLRAAAEAAGAVAAQGGGGVRTVALTRQAPHHVNTVEIFPEEVGKAAKVALLQRVDEAARSAGAAIAQVSAGYGDSRKRIIVANSDGLLAEDEQVRHLLRISVVANGDAGMQTGFESLGHTIGFEVFDSNDVEELARTAARQAITKLRARPAPSGSIPVVIKAGSGGVLFHEACGHGLEADLVGKNSSVYAGKVGEQVASSLVTLVDDGTMAGEWGAIGIDDEGHASQYNELIKDGVLTDYMWDHLRARKEGHAHSGNGRRQSYMHLPMVRMTNTYVLNGTETPEDIIKNTPNGVYVAKLGGGSVNTASGDFVFGMTEAYLIENGEITEPLREGNLIGNGPQVLRDIEALGNDFAMGNPGTCGKDGQGVPVGDGQPTLRVKAMTIGGTAA